MKAHSVFDRQFARYGETLDGYDFRDLLRTLEAVSPMPADGTVYLPSCAELEALPVSAELRDRAFGGLAIQMGYCCGANSRLECLEYHKSSEVIVSPNDIVLFLGHREEIRQNRYHSGQVQAFHLPAGTGIELYANTLHHVPCDAVPGSGFRMACVLPAGTNTDIPADTANGAEGTLLRGKNKWLLAHPQSKAAKKGAVIGLDGEIILWNGE